MEKLNRVIKKLFCFALALSIGFPAGVLCIIFGAIKGITALLVLGIIFAVAGFYVMPILWIKFGEKIQYRTLLFMIENEHIYTVTGLSEQTGYSVKRVRYMINYLILKNYLTGYLYKNDTLELNTNKKQSVSRPHTKKCNNCGGTMSYDGVKYVCDYCDATAKKE